MPQVRKQEEYRRTYYQNRILKMLGYAMYEDMATLHDESDDHLRRNFFAGMDLDVSRSEVVETVSKRIFTCLHAEALRTAEYLKSEAYQAEDENITALEKKIQDDEDAFHRHMQKVDSHIRATFLHHVELVELLRSNGVDPLPIFIQNGMPQYFVNQLN